MPIIFETDDFASFFNFLLIFLPNENKKKYKKRFDQYITIHSLVNKKSTYNRYSFPHCHTNLYSD